jgi:hypothetical protein
VPTRIDHTREELGIAAGQQVSSADCARLAAWWLTIRLPTPGFLVNIHSNKLKAARFYIHTQVLILSGLQGLFAPKVCKSWKC